MTTKPTMPTMVCFVIAPVIRTTTPTTKAPPASSARRRAVARNVVPRSVEASFGSSATSARSICSSRRNSSSESGAVSSRQTSPGLSVGSASNNRYPRPKIQTENSAGEGPNLGGVERDQSLPEAARGTTMHLAHPRLGDPEHPTDLGQGQTLEVVQGDDHLVALNELVHDPHQGGSHVPLLDAVVSRGREFVGE